MSKKTTMIIEKEMKFLHKQIKWIFSLIGADNKSVVYINNNQLYYMSNSVSGMLRMSLNEISVFEELINDREYELSRLPGNKYKLTEMPYDEEKKSEYIRIQDTVKLGDYICSVDAGDYGVVSKISILSRYSLSDAFAKSISKFGSADIYVNQKGNGIVLVKRVNEDNYSYMINESYYCVNFDDLEAEKEYKKNL